MCKYRGYRRGTTTTYVPNMKFGTYATSAVFKFKC